MQRVRDLFITYDLIKRLTTPFEKMDAYKLGIIDDKGNFLKSRSTFTSEEKNAVTRLDTVVINIKKLAGRFLPGKLGTYAAALALLREHQLEDMTDKQLFETANKIHEGIMLTEEMVAGADSSSPTNNASDGDINLDPIVKKTKNSITYRAKKSTMRKCIRGKCRKERFDEYIDDDEGLLTAVRAYARKHPNNSIILQDEEDGSRIFLKYGKNGSFGIPPRS